MRLVVFNLFLAIVLDCYNEIIKESNAIISQNQIDTFLIKWAEFDHNGTGFIKFDQLITILFESKPPIGFTEFDKANDL